jgi:pimeloyl-ACP methyl ester carboxylesterase
MSAAMPPVMFIHGLWLHPRSWEPWLHESNDLYELWTIPAPGEAADANFSPHTPAQVNTKNDERGPLLLIMGGQDHTVPGGITRSTPKRYRHSSAVTELTEFADRGHSLTIDHGWRGVADECLAWLERHGL